ncbi:MAG: FG-GAP repeat protein, partial [Blastocatellia bacterium]
MQSVIRNHGRIKPGARGLRAIALILLLGSLLSLSQWLRPVAGGAAPALQGAQDFVQQQKLVASDGERADQFGISVAVSDETIVVGVPFDNGGSGKGSAYVFTRGGTGWTEQQKLMPSDGVNGDFFGHSVAISGGTIVVGAPSVGQSGAEDLGAVYVFARSGTGWIQQQKITAGDPGVGDLFGQSVAVSGGTIVV